MAQCQICLGTRRVMVQLHPGLAVWYPCQDCGGSGIEHCCDGLQEQALQISEHDIRHLGEVEHRQAGDQTNEAARTNAPIGRESK